MNTHNVLSGVLAVQVALAALTWWPTDSGPVEATKLIEGGADAITAFTIQRRDSDAPVELTSDGGTWSIQTASGYPADADKVGEVVDALGEIEIRSPIATRAASHEALSVDEASYEKKVEVTTASGTTTFYVGAAASKAVHLRREGEDAVYKVKGLSAFTLKDNARGYLPANVVDVDKEALAAFSITNAQGSASFVRGEDGWEVEGDAPVAADADALDELLNDALKIRLSEVVGDTVAPEHGLTEPTVRISWSTSEGEQNVPGGYVIGAENDGKYYLTTDDSGFVVLAPSYRVEDLIEADPTSLVVELTGEMGAPSEQEGTP